MEPGQGSTQQIPSSVSKIAGRRGQAKLRTHEKFTFGERRIRATLPSTNLRDKNGNPPADGQRGEAEYALPDKAAMMAHLEQHMGDEPQPQQGGDDEQDGAQPQPQPQAGPQPVQ